MRARARAAVSAAPATCQETYRWIPDSTLAKPNRILATLAKVSNKGFQAAPPSIGAVQAILNGKVVEASIAKLRPRLA